MCVIAPAFFMLTPMRAYGTGMSLTQLHRAYQVAKQNSMDLARKISVLNGREARLSHNLTATEQAMVNEQHLQTVQGAIVARMRDRALRDRRLTRRFSAMARRANDHLGTQLRFWYEQGSIPLIEVIFGANSFSDLLYRVSAMELLLQRQKSIFLLDVRIVRQFHALTRRAQRDVELADAAYARVSRIRSQIAMNAAHEQVLATQLATLKTSVASQRADQIQNMQRLASEISAVLLAKKRAAAAAAAKKGEQPPPVSNVLDLSAIRADLLTATHDAGVSSAWLPWLLLLVQYESSGNPAAVSPVSVDGQHASGLMQMLPDTFSRYALGGYGDIWNPVDNAIAAIEYIKAAYGAPWNIPGIDSQRTYRGY